CNELVSARRGAWTRPVRGTTVGITGRPRRHPSHHPASRRPRRTR
ncbi:MAG: hypothetical protein AVDCRST_MAG54-3960, partial [uncultured Actinomycetospora sp.]